ncbi:hypothetical protein PITCH_A190031 [uncultured Desulfobacterium sp.]|uniref:Uncharacterized protein n=1 Tax=uncultured Desulfobacterium sp. TaxID=201089 RepID=A0A445MVF7_9BACT|nr:hypothetical protein PITCH_A190031 [uncultured Desulfobacterium sp.]
MRLSIEPTKNHYLNTIENGPHKSASLK